MAGLAAGGWIGVADAVRGALWAPRPVAPADVAAIVVAFATAGLALGAPAGLLAAARRWPAAAARVLPACAAGSLYLAALAATRFAPRGLATPGRTAVAFLAAAAAIALAFVAIRAVRRGPAADGGPPPTPGRRLLSAAALPLAGAAVASLLTWSPAPDASRAAVSRIGAGTSPDLLVVLVDSLRSDRVGACGGEGGLTPRIDAFAAEAAVFLETRTSSAWTKPSVASLLTGLRPERHGILGWEDVLDPRVPTLFSLLDAAGYRTALFSDSPWPVPEFGFDRGVNGALVVPGAGGLRASVPWTAWAHGRDFLLDGHALGTPTEIRGAGDLSRRTLDWAGRDDGRPFAAYLHWMEPHHPYAPRAPSRPGRRRIPVPHFRGVVPFDRGTPMPAADLADLVANYDDEVRETDAAFGALLDGLRARGLDEGTVVLFLSDHGEEFFEHGGWTHAHSLFEEVVRIPCILRPPPGAGRGARVEGAARIEDMLPTLLDLCGLATDAPVDGRSLVPRMRGGTEAPGTSTGICRRPGSTEVVRSAIAGGWKLVAAPPGATGGERFFDLARDPGEARPVPDPPAEVAAALRALLEEAARIDAARGAAMRTTLPAEMRRDLEALGYLGRPDGGPR